jgi:formyl-CoA transferase
MLLGDLGADVIKVERPGTGDDLRQWGPPFAQGGESAYFLCVNRNKRSIIVDLKTEAGRDVVRELARRSDVLLENFKAGDLESMGLGYDALAALNPALVYCSITGFGQDGPYRDRPGYDIIIQAMGGIMSITGEPEGEPMKVGVAIADVATGLFATIAVLASLRAREKTGRGQRIDMALLDCQVALLVNVAANYLTTGIRPGRYGNAHPNISPYQIFRTQDGYLVLAVGNDAQWRNFCAAVGRPDWADSPAFRTNAKRVRNRDALAAELNDLFRTRTAAEWTDRILAAGVPCGPIQTVDQVFADPHVLARGMVSEVDHRKAGRIKLTGTPLKLLGTPPRIGGPPPLLGEDTVAVLREVLGLDAAGVNKLRIAGALGPTGPAPEARPSDEL